MNMQRNCFLTREHTERWLAALALCAVGLALTSCTAIARMGSTPLEGTPASTGLVVVEAEIDIIAALLGTRSSANPVGGWIVSEDGGQSVWGGSTSRGLSSDLVLFSNLTPGTWWLASLQATWTVGNSTLHGEYVIPLDRISEFRFEVKAGAPVYVGLQIEHDGGDLSVRFERREDAEDERET
jgi:hypothetical protein